MTPKLPEIVCRNCGNTIRRSDGSRTGWTHVGDWQGKRCPGLLVGASPDVEKIREKAYWAGQEDAARAVEQPDSILCDCSGGDSSPVNPRTLVPMDHHCDCAAVHAAATMLGAFSKTNHGRQCIHGTEMDEFYRSGSEGK